MIADYRWVSSRQLAEYDFAPADIPFVEKLQNQEIESIISHGPTRTNTNGKNL
jgi:hypothetical protein